MLQINIPAGARNFRIFMMLSQSVEYPSVIPRLFVI